ncbi:MAG: hypothetical protein ACI9D4_002229, partial [Polaribacter sp.]
MTEESIYIIIRDSSLAFGMTKKSLLFHYLF